MLPLSPRSTLFPYTTLFRSEALARELGGVGVTGSNQSNEDLARLVDETMARWGRIDVLVNSAGDRKSTRLNSSHPSISYAVFCLKKKNLVQSSPPQAPEPAH